MICSWIIKLHIIKYSVLTLDSIPSRCYSQYVYSTNSPIAQLYTITDCKYYLYTLVKNVFNFNGSKLYNFLYNSLQFQQVTIL